VSPDALLQTDDSAIYHIGNPTLNTLNSIWDVLGLEIEFKAKAAKPKAAAPASTVAKPN
jgi:hypothetical protein